MPLFVEIKPVVLETKMTFKCEKLQTNGRQTTGDLEISLELSVKMSLNKIVLSTNSHNKRKIFMSNHETVVNFVVY